MKAAKALANTIQSVKLFSSDQGKFGFVQPIKEPLGLAGAGVLQRILMFSAIGHFIARRLTRC
jgi:hypothetical protein